MQRFPSKMFMLRGACKDPEGARISDALFIQPVCNRALDLFGPPVPCLPCLALLVRSACLHISITPDATQAPQNLTAVTKLHPSSSAWTPALARRGRQDVAPSSRRSVARPEGLACLAQLALPFQDILLATSHTMLRAGNCQV